MTAASAGLVLRALMIITSLRVETVAITRA